MENITAREYRQTNQDEIELLPGLLVPTLAPGKTISQNEWRSIIASDPIVGFYDRVCTRAKNDSRYEQYYDLATYQALQVELSEYVFNELGISIVEGSV